MPVIIAGGVFGQKLTGALSLPGNVSAAVSFQPKDIDECSGLAAQYAEMRANPAARPTVSEQRVASQGTDENVPSAAAKPAPRSITAPAQAALAVAGLVPVSGQSAGRATPAAAVVGDIPGLALAQSAAQAVSKQLTAPAKTSEETPDFLD